MAAALRASLAGSLDLLDLAEKMKLAAITIAASAQRIEQADVVDGLPVAAAVRSAKKAAIQTLTALAEFSATGRRNPR